jgi:plasmid stabilization system protein ParE
MADKVQKTAWTKTALANLVAIVAYRIREDAIQILRVHHVARRWPRHL